MPKSVNKVILVGNVGTASAVKYSASGTPIAEFSLATNERFKDRSGEWQERVEWHTIVAWQRLAEIVGEFVVTGAKVYIEGKLQTSSWEDRETGQTRYRTEIVARDLVLLGSRGNGTGDAQERHPDPAARHETPTDNAEDPEDIPF
jgi:single-strand DNA-binding protein